MKKTFYSKGGLMVCLFLSLSATFQPDKAHAQLPSFTRAYEVTGPFTRVSSNNSNMIVTPYYATPVSQAGDKGYLIASNVDNGSGSFVVKLTAVKSNGDQLWSKTYGDFSVDIRCFAITHDARDNGYVLTGYRSAPATARQQRDYLWLLKVNASGDALKEYSFAADSIPCTVGGGPIVSLCHSFDHPSIYGMSILQVSNDPDSAKNGDFVIAGFMSESSVVENYDVLKRNFVWRFRLATSTPVVDTFAAAEPLGRFLKVYHSWGNAGTDNQPTSEDFATDVQEIAGHGIMVLGHVTGAPPTPTPPSVTRRPYYALLNYNGGGASTLSSSVFQYANYTNTADIKNVRTVYGSNDAIYMLGYYYPTHSFTITPIKTTAGAAGLTRIYSSSAATNMPAFSMYENNANSSELVVMGYRLKTLSASDPVGSVNNFLHPFTIRINKNGSIISKFNLDSIKSTGYINYAPANPDSNRDYFRPFEKSGFPLATVPQIGLLNSHLNKNDAVVTSALYGILGILGNRFHATLTEFQQIDDNAECHAYQLPPAKDSILLAYNPVTFNINNVNFKVTGYTTVVTPVGTVHPCAEIQPSERKTAPGTIVAGNEAIMIYPNPASGMVTLQAMGNGSYLYKVTTVTGTAVTSGSFVQKTSLSVSNWADGIYLVHITGASGQQQVYKFVKQ